MALAEQANLVVSLSLKDQLSGALKGVQRQADNLDSSFGRTQTSLARLGTNVVRAGIVGIGVVVGGLAAGFAVSIRAASDFEAQLNIINTVAGVSAGELRGIGDSLRQLAVDTGTPLEELTAAYYDLVSAGIAAADAQDVLTAANTLAIGGLATTGETIDLLTTAINSYGLEASEAGDIADFFAQSIAAGKVTAADLAASFAQVAPLAASMGVEIEELAAGYAQLTASGVPAAEASTQMRSALVALQRPTTDLEAMQRKLKVNFADIAAEEGLAVAYAMIAEEAERTDTPLITLLGRVESTGYALAVTGDNAEGYATNLDAVRTSTEGAGEASRQAAARQQGLSFQLDKVKAIGQDVAIMFGQEMLPSITRAVTKLGELIELNYPKLERLAGKVGDAFDSVFSDKNITSGMDKLTTKFGQLLDALDTIKTDDIGGTIKDVFGFLKDLPWGTISEGMKITGQAAKVALDAFKSLPPDVQKGLITLLAANKLSGGLVTSVFGDLAGIALRSLTTINAANVTVIGPTTGGVPGRPGVPGGPGAALAGALGPIAIGAVSAIAIDQLALAQADAISNIELDTDAANVLASTPFFSTMANAVGLGNNPLTDMIDQRLGPGGSLASVMAMGNEPLGQFLGGLLGPGFREVVGEIGVLGNTALRGVETEAQVRAGVDRMNILAGVGNAHTQIANSKLDQAVASAQRNNALSETANLRLEHIARKDLSVNVNLRTTFQVSAREIASQLQHWTNLRGENEFG